ncbi:MAG: hydroxymyristoyl-ACP dehydratase [Bacteroidales bacterium]|nr:hydroxymyristoyl-ACP dehydratase [Bacteroidota bacterium]HPB36003.1 hydroxymyristoyl-ACP dehydratase [Bacteroidales bacterium]HQN87642.1 hydroxymyristoyl-ACP dehydratase [Bacteroidales bacterium]
MNNILELIPQREPMVMVDEFLGMGEAVSKTRFTVREDNLFVDNGQLSECGLIEHIAQSAAARIGYIFKSKNEPVPIGYIGSVNDFIFSRAVKPGETIETTVKVLQEVLNITLIEARCYINDKEVASSKMKIFIKE